jgi:hypothetical protein
LSGPSNLFSANEIVLGLDIGPRMAKTPGLIGPRVTRILRHRNFYVAVSIGLGAFVLLCLLRLPPRHPDVKVVELAGPVLAFTSIGFAISLAAVALILAMPFDRVTALLVANTLSSPPTQVVREGQSLRVVDSLDRGSADDRDHNQTAYLELIAVFLITAIANVISSSLVILWAIVVGGDNLLSAHSIENSLFTGIVTAGVTYSTAQMLTAITTMYQVAILIQRVMRSQLKNPEHRDDRTK